MYGVCMDPKLYFIHSHCATCMQGQSWSMGMDEGAQTVANFLKFYNPSIIGGSLGQHLTEVSTTHK